MKLNLARHINDAFYWVATSRLGLTIAANSDAAIVADPDTAPAAARFTGVLEQLIKDLTSQKRSEAFVNFPIPYEIFDKNSSPYPDAVAAMTSLLDVCRDSNLSISASRKVDGTGFYLKIDTSSPFQGLSWKKPSYGMRLEI